MAYPQSFRTSPIISTRALRDEITLMQYKMAGYLYIHRVHRPWELSLRGDSLVQLSVTPVVWPCWHIDTLQARQMIQSRC